MRQFCLAAGIAILALTGCSTTDAPKTADAAGASAAASTPAAPAQAAKPAGSSESVFSKVGFCDNSTGAITGPCAARKTYQPRTLATASGTGASSTVREEQDDADVQP